MQNGDEKMRASNPDESGENPDNSPVASAKSCDIASKADLDEPILGPIADAHFLGLDEVEPPAPPDRKQWASLGIFVLMSIALIASGLVITAYSEKKASTLAAEQARLEQSVNGRGQVLKMWIENHLLASRRLTESELVRLFASEMALNPAGRPPPRLLLDQQPYFQTLMAAFVEQNNFARAAVIDQKGRLLLSSSGPALNVSDILAEVSGRLTGWKNAILPIRSIGNKSKDLFIDVLIPLPKSQASDESGDNDVLILALILPVNGILRQILTVPSSKNESESLSLVQHRGNVVEKISFAEFGYDIAITSLDDNHSIEQNTQFSRWLGPNDQWYYSLSQPLPGTNWTIVHTLTSRAALAPVEKFTIVAAGIALAVVLVFGLGFASFWWRRISIHHQECVSLHQSLLKHIDRQRRFLAAITNSISDWLVVSSKEGRYIYANPAFATALGLPETEIIGRHGNDVLRLQSHVQSKDTLNGLVDNELVNVVNIGDRHHFIAVSSADLRNQHGQSLGTVTVMRDQTKLVEHRQQRTRALTETIDAFVHAVERRDPFLLGHTRRLRSYAIALGQKFALEDDELTGLALAASLSQIGKIFIPDKILVKPERHDQGETETMRGHIDHALGILGRIEFGFPVVDILQQMHERLDGSGYPNGLAGADIGLPGRILAVSDVFCARTAPRSYRERLSAGNALYYLANNHARYDINVIAALAEVVAAKGELDDASIQDQSFLDSRIWMDTDHDLLAKTGAAAARERSSQVMDTEECSKERCHPVIEGATKIPIEQ